jgi:hypothetical protein
MHPERTPGELKVWLDRMERDISTLLGDVQDFIGNIPEMIRLTNGATEDRGRKRSLPFLKVSGRLRAPRAARPWLESLLRYFGVDSTSCRFEDVETNTIVLVPKNWKTHRTIAKEPTHSLPFQLALDGFLKKRLKKWRIDLSSQSANQERARLGSLDGSFATIDLEMASDTLSYNAVAWMLPLEWFNVFETFRSKLFRAPWGSGEYAKYSSMGNGYTFSLETLIFAAACRAVGSRQYAVYGDDIAIETKYAPSVVELLRFLGFKTNEEKSFLSSDSRFRESCGCDYYKGVLVTPFYMRECPNFSDSAAVSHVLNGVIGCTGPGPVWDYARDLVYLHHLRLVPWNEDSRSGVFIDVHTAWGAGKLRTDRSPRRKGKDNPNYGFPVFDGYVQRRVTRPTRGWRSLFLWHLQASCQDVEDVSFTSGGRGQILLASNNRLHSSEADADLKRVTSSVTIRTTYAHGLRRYFPVKTMTPFHLYEFTREIEGDARFSW